MWKVQNIFRGMCSAAAQNISQQHACARLAWHRHRCSCCADSTTLQLATMLTCIAQPAMLGDQRSSQTQRESKQNTKMHMTPRFAQPAAVSSGGASADSSLCAGPIDLFCRSATSARSSLDSQEQQSEPSVGRLSSTSPTIPARPAPSASASAAAAAAAAALSAFYSASPFGTGPPGAAPAPRSAGSH